MTTIYNDTVIDKNTDLKYNLENTGGYMRINSIQPTNLCYNKLQNTQKTQRQFAKLNQNEPPETSSPTFKGSGNGFLIGLGTGLIGGLAAFGTLAITGGLALPALIGGYAVVATGFGGGILGDKIEDKLCKTEDKK